MSIEKLKNRFANGAWITDIKHYFNKINEIIDYINNSSSGVSYTSYVALVNQTGTNAPTLTVLENTTGQTLTLEYDDVGYYYGVWTGDYDKTFVTLNNPKLAVEDILSTISAGYDPNGGWLYVTTYDSAGAGANDILSGAYLEIRVYS